MLNYCKRLRVSLTGCAVIATMAFSIAVQAADIELRTGDKLTGKVVSQTAEETVIEHPILGKLSIKSQDIKEIKLGAGDNTAPPAEQSTTAQAEAPATGPATATAPASDAPTPATVVEAAPGTQPATQAVAAAPAAEEEKFSVVPKWMRNMLKEWKSQVELGASGQSYVQNSINFRFAFNTTRSTEDNLTKIDFTYLWGQTNDVNVKNELSTGIRNDFNLGEKPYVFLLGRYDYNQFGDWDHRLIARAGPGYWFIKEDNFKLNGELGIGAYKQFGSPNEDITPEASIGGALTWNITKHQKFTAGATFLPQLSYLGRFRAIANAEYSFAMPDVDNMVFKIGLTEEYTSFILTPQGVRNNFNYYAALVIGF